MKINVKLLKPFSDIAGKGEVELDFEGKILSHALNKLCELYPDLKKEIFDDNGEITYSVNIFLNDSPITALQDVDSPLKDGDEILIFMPVGGG
ncbi:MAG: MoaD family protein [Thermoplasmata archaeon]|nr:MAG: MoaD family protein [Thermoplasmata archaeon]